MTNEEAIKELIDILLGYPMSSPRFDALELAINALKAVNLLDDLLVIERDGIYRPIKNTTKEECYKAIYEISKIMEEVIKNDR